MTRVNFFQPFAARLATVLATSLLMSLSAISLNGIFVPPAHALDLLQAWQAAKAKDPQLATSRFQQEANNERVAIAKANLGTSITGNANIARQEVDTNRDPNRSFTSQIYGVNLTLPLYRKPALEALEQSRLLSTQSELALNSSEQDLILRVAQAYTDVLAAQDALRAAQTQRRAATEQLNVVKIGFEKGASARIDLQDAIARSDIAMAQEVAARNDLLIRQNALTILTGVSNFEIHRLKPDVLVPTPDPRDSGAWIAQARRGNLQVQQAEVNVEVAKREVSKQSAASRPTLDLVGSVGRSNNAAVNFIGIQQNTAQIGLQLNLPIYTGGAISARVREASALQNKAASELDGIRELADQNARQLFIKINSGKALVAALESAVQSSKTALDVTQLGFLSGARLNIDVLNALQQVFTTSRDLARARYDLLLDTLKLKQSVGNLKEEDIAGLNNLLQPLGREVPN